MPYIKRDRRPALDPIIDSVIKCLKGAGREYVAQVVSVLTTDALAVSGPDFTFSPTLNPLVTALGRRLREIECVRGDVNYTVTRVVLESMKPRDGWGYHSLSDTVSACRVASRLLASHNSIGCNACISVCDDVADEIHRRLLGPYEDTAIQKNGDMACFQEPFAHVPLMFEFETQEELEMFNDDYDLGPIPSYVGDPLPTITDAFTDEQIAAIEEQRREAE
jgi:hypothetical protein